MAGETVGGNEPPENAVNGNTISIGGDGLSSIFDGPIIEPAEINGGRKDDNGNDSETGGEETGKRKRGRPKGSGKTKARASVHLDISGVEKLLLVLHIGASKVFKIAELEIDESEAKQMAEALTRVQKHYPILDKIGDKAIDHANLVSTFGTIYGSRFFAYQMRKASEKANPIGPTVVGFPGHG